MKNVVVIGLGRIGKSISMTLAQNGCNVTVISRREQNGYNDLRSFIEKNSGHKDQISLLWEKISCAKNFEETASMAELVIEAITECLAEKKSLFEKIDRVYPSTVVLSSTTSSLNIDDISQNMFTPERMIGLHFFNPSHYMKLVEVIPGKKTSHSCINKTTRFVQAIGKVPIIAPNKPGFIVNRVLFTMINEAINVLEEGDLSAEDIDNALKLGANHPMGPLHLADFIGLDVCLKILENLSKDEGDKYSPHPLIIEKVKRNELGRKTGKGFFNYLESTDKGLVR